MKKPNSYKTVLRNPGFLNLWFNQILVQLAYNSLNFALIIWVFKITESSFAVSLLIFAIYLPAVVFGLFAGIFVDLLDRRKIIIAINFLLAFLILSLIILKTNFLAILSITFLVNSLAQFYMPSESSAIPVIVKKDQLMAANALFSTTLFAMFLLGFGLSGPLINLFGIDTLFLLGGLIQTIAFILSFQLPRIITKPDKDSLKMILAWKCKDLSLLKDLGLSEIKQTLKIIKGKLSVFFSIGILAGVQGVIAVFGVIIPSFLETVLQINAEDGSYIIITPLGVGMVLGALAVGKIGHFIPKRILAGIAIIFSGLLLFMVGFAPLVSPAIQYLPAPRPLPFTSQPFLSTIIISGSFLLGTALVSIVIPSQTVLQSNTKEQDRGKIFSVLGTLMSAIALVPALIVGILSDYLGTTPIFIGLGGLIAILGFLNIKPDFFFTKKHLSLKVRQFLGLGHWQR